MAEDLTPRAGRKAAQTNLTEGEKRLLSKLQAKLHGDSEADTIRLVLRDRFKAEGLL